MADKKSIIISILILLVLGFVSCKSTPTEVKDTVFAMIYDLENKPVRNISFYLDDKYIGKSDINGRFIFEMKDSKEHTLVLESDDYEKITDKVQYEASLVLYYKIGNIEQLLLKAEEAMSEKKYTDTINYINRALSINPKEEDALYFKALVYFKQNELELAEETLSNIEITDKNQIYIKNLQDKILQSK